MTEKGKLAMLGCAKDTLSAAKPIVDAGEHELWGLNNLMVYYKKIWEKASRWFDVHHPDYITEVSKNGYASAHLYPTATCPIYMYQDIPEIPTCVRYPAEEVCSFYSKDIGFFTSTASLMLALAIMENRHTEIHMYGIEMSTKDEYTTQRPAFYYLIGIAEMRGIRLFTPAHSKLMNSMMKPYFGMNGTL